jgi:methyltransferase (TIGR00027 family)
VAAERAVLADMGVIHDRFARRMLSPSMAATFAVVRLWPSGLRARSLTLAGLAARVLWFDAQVAKALEAGITQIAVIGAGYDSRAWRFGREGVRFFELDHGVTQSDKVGRAPGPGPTYVEADLTTQSAGDELRKRGLDPAQPTLFVIEGVTMYLTENVVRSQLAELARSSTVGSRLAVDFYPPADTGTARHRRQMRLQRLARAGSAEGFRLCVDRSQAEALVEASGWEVDEATNLREAAEALVPADSGLPVGAVNQHKTLVAARLRRLDDIANPPPGK